MDTDLNTHDGDAFVPDDTASDDRPDAYVEALAESIGAESFADWYREREFAQNIREGQPYFNGPSRVPDPERHSPSQLNQCHRKIYYRQLNAPEEQPDPQGIFWTGTRFEEELVVPYLESVVDDDRYIRNSMWIDVTCETDAGEVRIKGATDPVIVDAESEPILLTESKTKRSIDRLDAPDRRHRAQAHCYMYGLTQKYDRRVTDALLLYGSRASLDFKSFHVTFDPWFWRQTVLGWAEEHTQLRLDEELPPAVPEQSWECNNCSYRHRCGRGDITSVGDMEATGLIPRFADYPRQKVREYLDSHDDVQLTPTLARRYPELAGQYDVQDWWCQRCSNTYPIGTVEGNGTGARAGTDVAETPLCPDCANEDVPVPLKGRLPNERTPGTADG